MTGHTGGQEGQGDITITSYFVVKIQALNSKTKVEGEFYVDSK
jgi:hypothetical protein